MKKLLIALMIGLSLTGCTSKEERELKKQDSLERTEAEFYMRIQGVEEEEIERTLKEMEEEQDRTREDRLKENK